MIRFIADNIPILGSIVHWLKVPFFNPKESAFFYKAVLHTVRYRRETGMRRNDLIDLMIEAMSSDISHELDFNEYDSDQFEKDAMLHDNKIKRKSSKDLSDLDIVATAMAMLTAGYDTTAQTLTYIG